MRYSSIFFLYIISLFVFLISLDANFICCDPIEIINNPYIKSWALFAMKVFDPITSVETWGPDGTIATIQNRPLLYLSFLLNYKLGGPNPSYFRIINIFLHFICVSMFVKIVKLLLPSSSPLLSFTRGKWFWFLLVGFLLLNPIYVNSVTHISKRSDLMASFFIYISIYFFIRGVKMKLNTNQSLILSLIASVASFICAILCKEFAIVLPGILFLYLYFFSRQRNIKTYLQLMFPYILVTIMIFIWRHTILSGITRVAQKGLIDYSELPYYISSQVVILLQYIFKIFFPLKTYLYYPIGPYENLINIKVVISFILLVVLVAILILLARKSIYKNVVYFSLSSFFLLLLPTIIIPQNTYFSECRLYSCAGFLFFAVILLAYEAFKTFNKNKNIVEIMIGAYLIAFCYLNTHTQILHKHPHLLWESIAADFENDDNMDKRRMKNVYSNLVYTYIDMAIQEGNNKMSDAIFYKNAIKALQVGQKQELLDPTDLDAKANIQEIYKLIKYYSNFHRKNN
ncbi:MAG: hypothetical protein HQK49_10550 [Oligoflexia bacterium]|nr:hypothetical protein [Oligoflexia bacterium]